ncbi:MAG: xanthine dehydrogenase accessory protein XdhC [Burkholderiaceae bacterium]
MSAWLSALLAQQAPAILVTVAHAEGSVPREAGARMLVAADRLHDTIGGGHLEYVAERMARDMLAQPAEESSAQRRLERLPLGPTLGQCCGGVAFLAFERVEPAGHAHFRDIAEALTRNTAVQRRLSLDSAAPPLLEPASAASTRLINDAQGARWLLDLCAPPAAQLYLFGAGHVGAAIVRAMAGLPCQIIWIDEREDQFPAQLPANVRMEATDTPEALVAAAPDHASFLVMTHSHALDQALAEAILRRERTGWFGLIGSSTKRISFERRLRQRGITDKRLADMVCPIGIPGIAGKEPAVIAIAVAAQLLQVWQAQARARANAGATEHGKKQQA